ncbi:MAG: hypothetical protein IT379_20605 [Deltaproteobacteria bacterium]|nr:hypothetical protein [Deltaproteobacteria bacterium]
MTRGHRGWWGIGVAVVACAGCASTPRQTPGTTTSAAVVTPAEEQEPSGHAVLLPMVRSPWVAGTEPDGTRHVVIGPMRATLRGTSPTWSEHRFAAPIVVAARVASGWVFIAADGAIARSDSFTGALQRLGSVAGYQDRGMRALTGRVTAIDQDHGLWSTDGSGPAERMVVAGDEPVLDAAFSDHVHGAVALESGALFYTSDAGRGWRPVDLAGDAVMRLDAEGGRLVVGTTSGFRYLDEPGTLGAEAPTQTLGQVTQLPEADANNLRDKLLLQDPSLVDWWGISRADGTAIMAFDRDLAVVERATGRILERHPAHLPERCRLTAWGPHVAASCGVAGLFRIESGVALTQVATRAMAYPTVFSDDGQHAALTRGCDASEEANRICLLAPGAMEPRTVEFRATTEFSSSRAMSMHGAELMVRISTNAGEQLLIVDARSGESTPVRIAGAGDDDEDSPTVFEAWWVSDGSLVGVGGWQRWADGPRVLVRGASPTALEPSPLPIGARRVGFLDAARGFAVGRHAGRLWQTLDGGRRWTPLLATVEGLPATIELAELDGELACRFGSCVFANALLLRAEPSAGSVRPVVAATERRRRRPLERYGVAAREYIPGFECRLAGAPRAQPALPRGQAPASGSRSLVVAGAGARARIDVWRSGEALSLSIAWRGEDARGAFSGRTRPMPLTGPDAAADDLEAPTSVYVMRGATREGVLVERCGRSTYACGLVWGGPDQVPHAVEALPPAPRGATWSSRLELEQVVPTPSGGFLTLWRGYASPGQITALTELDARGQVARRRVLRWAADRYSALTALASHGGVFGLAYEDVRQPGRVVLHPVSGEPPIELPRIRNVRELGTCAEPESPNATSLWSTRMLVPRFRGQDDLRGRLELASSGRVCVRAAESWLERWSSAGAATERGVSLRAQSDGRMTGHADQGTTRQQLVCTRDRY